MNDDALSASLAVKNPLGRISQEKGGRLTKNIPIPVAH